MPGKKNGKVKLIWISTSVVVALIIAILAISMAPSSQNQQVQQVQQSSQQDSIPVVEAETEADEVPPISQPLEDVGEVEEISCDYVHDGVVIILGIESQNNPQLRFASELLMGEFCNRPELVREMTSFHDPSLGLVAYACDAATGMKGDTTLQESLSVYNQIYCDSSRQAIILEIDSAIDGVESYKNRLIQESDSQEPSDENDELADDAQSPTLTILDGITDDLNAAKTSVMGDGGHYEAVALVDNAKDRFASLLEEITGEA